MNYMVLFVRTSFDRQHVPLRDNYKIGISTESIGTEQSLFKMLSCHKLCFFLGCDKILKSLCPVFINSIDIPILQCYYVQNFYFLAHTSLYTDTKYRAGQSSVSPFHKDKGGTK